MMEDTNIYVIARGDENSVPVVDNVAYECLEDAIQEARLLNSRQLISDETSLEDVVAFWEQRTGEDLSDLLTAGLVDKNIAEIAEAAKSMYGNQMSVQEAIDTVIQDCYEGNFLPPKWYGVLQMTFHKTEED